jgi:hypothetical protein
MGCMCATLHPTVYKRHRQSLRIIHDGTKNQTDAAHQSCKSVAKHLLFFFPCPIELMGIVVLYMERLGRDLLAPWWPMFWLVTRALHRHMGYFFDLWTSLQKLRAAPPGPLHLLETVNFSKLWRGLCACCERSALFVHRRLWSWLIEGRPAVLSVQLKWTIRPKRGPAESSVGVHIVAIDVDGVSMAVGCGRFGLRRSDGAAVGVVDDL